MTCLAFWASDPVHAQVPNKGVSVGFTNKTQMNVIVKGYTVINNVKRSGPALSINKNGGQAYETNVPAGNTRYYTVFDSNYRILLRDQTVTIQNSNVVLDIVPDPNNPKGVLVQERLK
jgi:hypothetical protein